MLSFAVLEQAGRSKHHTTYQYLLQMTMEPLSLYVKIHHHEGEIRTQINCQWVWMSICQHCGQLHHLRKHAIVHIYRIGNEGHTTDRNVFGGLLPVTSVRGAYK